MRRRLGLQQLTGSRARRDVTVDQRVDGAHEQNEPRDFRHILVGKADEVEDAGQHDVDHVGSGSRDGQHPPVAAADDHRDEAEQAHRSDTSGSRERGTRARWSVSFPAPIPSSRPKNDRMTNALSFCQIEKNSFFAA